MTFVTPTISSIVHWLATHIVDHRLSKDLKDYQGEIDQKLQASKAELDTQLEETKANVKAVLRKEVEEYLGDKAAERHYRLQARKRIYSAVGPLRFQLILACNEFASRAVLPILARTSIGIFLR